MMITLYCQNVNDRRASSITSAVHICMIQLSINHLIQHFLHIPGTGTRIANCNWRCNEGEKCVGARDTEIDLGSRSARLICRLID